MTNERPQDQTPTTQEPALTREELSRKLEQMEQEINILQQNERVYQETIIRLSMKLAGTL